MRPLSIVGLIATAITGALLLAGMGDFPDFGDANSPANAAPLATKYITQTASDTHVPNMVTAVLADYRGYDTMFETVVVFIAGICIIAILRSTRAGVSTPLQYDYVSADSSRIIIGTTVKLLTPIIQLFALYVLAHGHHSPGGGFQGGVIFGASFILLGLTGGLDSVLKTFTQRRFILFAGIGVLIYAGHGVLTMLLGRNFLDYGALKHVLPFTGEEMARSHAMLGIETGVLFTVTAVMFAIYAHLSTSGRLDKGL